MKKILFYFILAIISIRAVAQVDTEFWFASPGLITANSSSRNYVRVLSIATYDHAAKVTITQPANPGFTPVVITVPANSMDTLHLEKWSSHMLSTPADQILNFGIYITSDYPVSVYYAVTQADSEIYTLKGQNGLGTNFLVPMQYSIHENSGTASSIEIVATADNTLINITPSQDCVGHTKGITFT